MKHHFWQSELCLLFIVLSLKNQLRIFMKYVVRHVYHKNKFPMRSLRIHEGKIAYLLLAINSGTFGNSNLVAKLKVCFLLAFWTQTHFDIGLFSRSLVSPKNLLGFTTLKKYIHFCVFQKLYIQG